MASIFNLQILNNDKYNFETNSILKKKGTPNQKRQFVKKEDLGEFLKRIETVYGHCKYIRNHIKLYCNNPRYKKSFEHFKNSVLMLSFADLKFNKHFNLNKNLKEFHSLFQDVKSNASNNSNSMNIDYKKLLVAAKKLHECKPDDWDKTHKAQINSVITKAYLKKLNNVVKNIQACYEETHKRLLEYNCKDNKTIDRIRAQIPSSIQQQEAILFYGFVLNLKYIKDFCYNIKNGLIKKLEGTDLFKDISK